MKKCIIIENPFNLSDSVIFMSEMRIASLYKIVVKIKCDSESEVASILPCV